MGMATTSLSLKACSDGYYRTYWFDDRGGHHSKCFGRKKREAQTRFSRFHADWQSDPEIRYGELPDVLTCEEAWKRFKAHAEQYYRHADDTPTGHATNMGLAVRPVIDLFGGLPAAEFGPKLLKAVRQRMIDDQLCRNVINQRVRQIRQVFKWLASEELIPTQTWQGLQAVQALSAGRSEAVESELVTPVPESYIWKVADAVSGPVRAMILLQYYSACRPGEACAMRPCDLECKPGTRVWRYRPVGHRARKTQHAGINKVILLGPNAQKAIADYLKRDTKAYCFSPLEAERERYSRCTSHRHQAVLANQTGRKIGSRYTTGTYYRAIAYACDRVFPPPAPLQRRDGESLGAWKTRLGKDGWQELSAWQIEHRWSPNRLRHNALTRIEDRYGIELARIIAGHTTAETTEIYLQRDLSKASDAIAAVG